MTFIKELFNPSKPQAVPPPPTAPTRAESSLATAGLPDGISGFRSLVSTSTSGLKRKAKTAKTSLVGGA